MLISKFYQSENLLEYQQHDLQIYEDVRQSIDKDRFDLLIANFWGIDNCQHIARSDSASECAAEIRRVSMYIQLIIE